MDVVQACVDIHNELADSTVSAIGIGTAGQVETSTGNILFGNRNIKNWTGVPLGRLVAEATTLPVTVDNDVNAMAVAEMEYGAGREFRNALFITVGTGIGGAILFNNQLWRGKGGSAGEIGHTVVDLNTPIPDPSSHPGNLESIVAGPSMEREYVRRGGDTVDLREITRRMNEGETLARDVITNGATVLGYSLAGMLTFLDMEALIIGGGVPNVGPAWWDPLLATLKSSPLPPVHATVIRPATLGQDAGIIGAALLKKESFA